MRSVLFSCCLLILTNVYSQQVADKDSLNIMSMISDWDQSWNSKDHLLASKWYSSDARFTNAFGHTKTGRSEIEALLKEVFALPFVMSGQSRTVSNTFQLLSSDVIIVHTLVERSGQKMPDGTAMPTRQTTHLRVFQKAGSSWQIKSHLISDARDRTSNKH